MLASRHPPNFVDFAVMDPCINNQRFLLSWTRCTLRSLDLSNEISSLQLLSGSEFLTTLKYAACIFSRNKLQYTLKNKKINWEFSQQLFQLPSSAPSSALAMYVFWLKKNDSGSVLQWDGPLLAGSGGSLKKKLLWLELGLLAGVPSLSAGENIRGPAEAEGEASALRFPPRPSDSQPLADQ